MERNRTFLRYVAALCFLLYLGGVGTAVLHAAEASPVTAETHVHGPKADCPPLHDDAHCPTCHFAFGSAAELATPWAPFCPPAQGARAAAGPHVPPSSFAGSLPNARAPPLPA
jgi:hypothetical protein